VRIEQPHREKCSSPLSFDLGKYGTATATATHLAFSDSPFLTSLRKRANITTVPNFLIFLRYKRHVFD
jgi:hypothetical protein